MDKQIFRYLKKYYLNFTEKYNELFLCKTDKKHILLFKNFGEKNTEDYIE